MEKILFVGKDGFCSGVIDSAKYKYNNDSIYVVSCGDEKLIINDVVSVGMLSDVQERIGIDYRLGFVALELDNDMREDYCNLLLKKGCSLVSVIDSSAEVAGDAKIGRNVYVGKKAVIKSEAVISDGAIINTAATIGEQCSIGAYSEISTAANVKSGVVIGKKCLIGAKAVIEKSIYLESGSIIGATEVIGK